MNLSERASKYLKKLKRDKKWTSNEDETKSYLMANGIALCDEFVRFQVAYSGYELKIKNNPGHTFSAYLFSQKQIKENQQLEIEQAGDRLIEICGDHKTAQFEFYITDKGEICTLDNHDLPNIIHSSFDKMLEQYALRNEIYNWSANPYYFNVSNTDRLTDTMTSEFRTIEECSDLYSSWWQINDLIAVRGTWLDRPELYFRVYSKNEREGNKLIDRFKKEGNIK